MTSSPQSATWSGKPSSRRRASTLPQQLLFHGDDGDDGDVGKLQAFGREPALLVLCRVGAQLLEGTRPNLPAGTQRSAGALSRRLKLMASVRWAVLISALASRSAMERATRRMR